MSLQIKLKNSVVQDSTPSASDLPEVGELAVNANINSIGGFMRASDNSIVKIFGPGSVTTPTATTTVSGIAELATNAETTTGTATNRVVTPAGLKAVTDAERATSNSAYMTSAGGTLTGALTMPNGSNSAAAINFGDSDSGIFGGTNTVSLTAGGTTRLTADTGVSVVGTLGVTGSVTLTGDLDVAADIRHTGDTDTRIRFPADNQVSIENGGAETLRTDGSQRLLIGTSTSRGIGGTATRKLQIEGTNINGLSLARNSSDNNPAFLSLGKSRSASVGGTTIVQDDDDLGEIQFCGADGVDMISRAATIRAKVDGTPGANDLPGSLIFSTTADGGNAPTDRLLIDSSGNVGIGTLTPSHRLHVVGPSGTNFAIEANASGCNFNLSDNDTTTSFRTVDGRLHIDADAGGAVDNSEIRFLVDSSQKFVIKNTGNVGIGTSDPSDKLHVAGDMIVADPSGTSTIDIRGAEGTNANLNLTADEGDDNGDTWILSSTASSNDFKIFNNESGGNVAKLTITTTGETTITNDLKIPDKIVHSGDTNTAIRFPSGDSFTVETGGTERLRVDNSAVKVASKLAGIDDTDTSIEFAGGNQIVFNTANGERMRLYGNGQLGIGTTDFGSYKVAIKATGASENGGGLLIDDTTTTSAAPYLNIVGRRSDGNTSFPFGGVIYLTGQRTDAKVAVNKVLGAVVFGGNHSSSSESNQRYAASITGIADNSFDSASDMPTALGFFTGDTGRQRSQLNTTAGEERMRIKSDGKIGIGTTSPNYNVHIHEDSSGASYLQFTNTTTGTGTNDGMLIGLTSGEEGLIYLRENDNLRIATNNTERMRIEAGGDVGIGETNPSEILHITHSSPRIILEDTGTNSQTRLNADSSVGNFSIDVDQSQDGSSPSLIVKTRGTERARFTNGGALCIGTSSSDSNGTRMTVISANGSSLGHFEKPGTNNKSIFNLEHGRATGSSKGNMIIFRDAGGTNEGVITTSATDTLFTNNSDYRLKLNVVALADGIARLKQLKPSRFNFKKAPTITVDGFLAHEVSPIVPNAVVGEKDAVITQALIDSGDAPEGEVGDEIHQQMDMTKMIPLITAALQEAIAKIEVLETKVTALEAA